jgi:hypothetical protein
VLRAAQGVKIAAKDLEKTVAGLNLLVANTPDEVEICKDEMQKRLDTALNSIKVKDRGVFVQASTLGSLEALVEFLRTSKIPVRSLFKVAGFQEYIYYHFSVLLALRSLLRSGNSKTSKDFSGNSKFTPENYFRTFKKLK